MPQGLLPLLTGTALALVALMLVLSPLISGDTHAPSRPRKAANSKARRGGKVDDGHESRDSAVVALREIEFDRATGKLSDSDYADLKERYTSLALDELRQRTEIVADNTRVVTAAASLTGGAAFGSVDEAVEALLERARSSQCSCEVCGPRPESDALYCSSCGRYLRKACPGCGTPVTLVGSHYCTNCGGQLGALERESRLTTAL